MKLCRCVSTLWSLGTDCDFSDSGSEIKKEESCFMNFFGKEVWELSYPILLLPPPEITSVHHHFWLSCSAGDEIQGLPAC